MNILCGNCGFTPSGGLFFANCESINHGSMVRLPALQPPGEGSNSFCHPLLNDHCGTSLRSTNRQFPSPVDARSRTCSI